MKPRPSEQPTTLSATDQEPARAYESTSLVKRKEEKNQEKSVDENDRQQQRHHQSEPHQRPGHRTITGMQLQQEHPRDAEHQARHRKDVDEPAPRRAGIAAFVQIVEIGNPA